MPSKPGIRPAGEARRVDAREREVVEEAEADDPEEGGDRELEAAVALRLQPEDRERDDGRDQAGGERRHAEQQVERDRGADELGEVGGDRDRLRLHPQAPGDRAREAVAAQLGQVAAGRDARLGRQVLHEHRHQVRGDDHPDEQVAVARAAGDVGGEVARVDVGDGGDEGGAEQGGAAAHAPAGAQPPQRAELRLGMAGQPRGGLERGRRVHACSSTLIARASSPPSTCTASSKRTNSGPSNGWRSSTSKRAPGAIPRSAR